MARGTRRDRNHDVIGKETVAIKPASKIGTKKPWANFKPATKITTIPAVTRMRAACSLDPFSVMNYQPQPSNLGSGCEKIKGFWFLDSKNLLNRRLLKELITPAK